MSQQSEDEHKVAATYKYLAKMLAPKSVREEHYYRLNELFGACQ
jgi:transcriptional regulator with PAS, ATPase and Fis domain